MKTLKNILLRLAVGVFLTAALVLTPPLLTGCQTATKSAYTASQTAKITVDAALKAWNDFIPIGHPTVQQELKVQAAFDQYKAAQLALLDAAIAYQKAKASNDANAITGAQASLNTAVATSSAALGGIITLLVQFGVNLK